MISDALVERMTSVKSAGGANKEAEIHALVRAYTAGEIDDRTMGQWVRAVFAQGMSLTETAALTQAMATSGDTIDWSASGGPVVDKHSTGGVGDSVTLVAVPLAAALGAKVAKLSGRALGHTGGTIDKLESIPGLRTSFSIEEFQRQVRDVGCAVGGANADLAPADKKLYALRDRLGCVASIPLITASILSKKVAAGAPAIVLDVKVGRGAFMQTLDEARELGTTMVQVGALLGRRVRILLTDMDSPLSDAVGDALEVQEALAVLRGASSVRLRPVAVQVAIAMLESCGLDYSQVETALDDGRAMAMFARMVDAQGGSLAAFESDIAATLATPVAIHAPDQGFVSAIDALAIGAALTAAKHQLSPRDATQAGVRVRMHVGQAVACGECVLTAYITDRGQEVRERFCAALRGAIEIAKDRPTEPKIILGELH